MPHIARQPARAEIHRVVVGRRSSLAVEGHNQLGHPRTGELVVDSRAAADCILAIDRMADIQAEGTSSLAGVGCKGLT